MYGFCEMQDVFVLVQEFELFVQANSFPSNIETNVLHFMNITITTANQDNFI